MPIFRINDQLHYFAHVPKCGGSAIEIYLAERFGPLGLNEPHRRRVPKDELWNRSASQHIPVFALERLIPRDWFTSSFAVVRNPVSRLISAFFYARDVARLTPLSSDFNSWFKDAATWIESRPFHYGGHLLPQSALVPEGARIFRFEDGLEQVVPYLDGLAGNSDGPRDILPRNVGKWRLEEAAPIPSTETLALIARVYAADYARFGFDAALPDMDTATVSKLPTLLASGKPPAAKPWPLSQRLLRSLLRSTGQ